MRSIALTAAAMAIAAGLLGLTGCEEHSSKAIRAAPEHLHAALSGDIDQQAVLAGCYAKTGGCLGIPPDPAIACAWRGVRLASEDPGLSLADTEAFTAACEAPEESFHQRASIALIDLGARIYNRRLGDVGEMAARTDPRAVLYPSIDQVRERVNQALSQGGESERLPRFAARRPGRGDGAVNWSSCAATICLEGLTPSFGGGVIGYRVTVRPSAASPARGAGLAGKLAAAALEAPAAADALAAAPARQLALGPVCWVKGLGEGGLIYAGALRAPCPAAAPWDGR